MRFGSTIQNEYVQLNLLKLDYAKKDRETYLIYDQPDA